MISTKIKKKIALAIRQQSENYTSYIKQSTALGISPSQISRVVNGETEGVLSDANWISIARKYNVMLKDEVAIKTARTTVFNYIYQQLEFAQANSVSGILCDRADIGKTHTAKIYAREHRNVAYVDCSRSRTQQRFIRAIAQEFGINNKGAYHDVFDNLVFYLRTIDNPMVILDEFGDLLYGTYLEFKALWNATDKFCGWYAMGADGLRTKLDRHINNKKVGFAEIFSRLGNKYQKITPADEKGFARFQKKQIADIGTANGCVNIQQLHVKTNLSLRRIPIQLGLERKEIAANANKPA